jgi:hypothetical protein
VTGLGCGIATGAVPSITRGEAAAGSIKGEGLLTGGAGVGGGGGVAGGPCAIAMAGPSVVASTSR